MCTFIAELAELSILLNCWIHFHEVTVGSFMLDDLILQRCVHTFERLEQTYMLLFSVLNTWPCDTTRYNPYCLIPKSSCVYQGILNSFLEKKILR
jgi:hypothetical protein